MHRLFRTLAYLLGEGDTRVVQVMAQLIDAKHSSYSDARQEGGNPDPSEHGHCVLGGAASSIAQVPPATTVQPRKWPLNVQCT